MKIGDRVAVGRHKGTLVVPGDEFFEARPDLQKVQHNYFFVQFDEEGPYGNGRGIYFFTTWMMRKINEPRRETVSNGNTGAPEGTTEVTGTTIKESGS